MNMEFSTIVLISILSVALALFIYAHSTNGATNKLLDRIMMFETKLKKVEEIEGRLAAKSFDVAQHRIQMDAGMKAIEAEVESLQDHVAKIRESQIGLREMLSKKRPIIRPDGPIRIEIVDTKVASSSIKQKAKVLKYKDL